MDSKMITLVIGLICIFLIPIFVHDLVPWMKTKMENRHSKMSRLNQKLGEINFQMRTEDNSGNPSYWELDKEKREIEQEIVNLSQEGDGYAQKIVQ